MTFEAKDKKRIEQANVRGGEGVIIFEPFTDNLPPHVTFIGETTMNPGCSIAPHEHHGECEIYYVLEGEAVLYDNGVERPFRVGELCICYDGCSHGWRNETDQPVRILAFMATTA